MTNSSTEIASEPPIEQIEGLMALVRLGAFEQLVEESGAALRSFPDSYKLWEILGSAYFNLANLDDAERCARRAVALGPHLPIANMNLARTLHQQGKIDEAIDYYRRAAELDPEPAAALYFQSVLLYEKRAFQLAREACEKVIKLKPDFTEAHYLLGASLVNQGHPELAIAAFDKAIALSPDHWVAHAGKGRAYFVQERFEAAIECLRRAIEINPDDALMLSELGNAFNYIGDPVSALSALDRALSINPNMPSTAAFRLGLQAEICDFRQTIRQTLPDNASPFAALALEDDPQKQMKRSFNAWRLQSSGITTQARFLPPAVIPAKLRIGYFSADFYGHATAYLLLGLLKEHDRSRFEIGIYSYGKQKEGRLHKKLGEDGLQFHDVESLTDAQLVEFARAQKLDIALDLKGYTRFTRSQIFAHRIAPIQINYLAYPGTLGTSEFDYLVADRTLIPETFRPFYAESIMYMPHSYQPNAYSMETAAVPTRRELGLPEEGLILCCFNASSKITASEFDIWMRVMKKVAGSVLWFIRSNAMMETNLRQEAAIRGVDPDRLIFSEKLDYTMHLARQKHADLFLDTFNYNAHTTGSDALWAGVPIVTKAGKQFCARVAASLLNAVGLPDLVTETEEEYEAKVLHLANNPEKLEDAKQRLARNRQSYPLFDTKRYARNFEAGLQLAYDRYFSGQKPADFAIVDQT